MKPVSREPAIAGTGTQAARWFAMRWWKAFLGLTLLICIGARCAKAQAAPKSNQSPASAASDDGEATNRKALEDQAGRNPAKLMLRSVPDRSSVRIDGKLVGKTPLLLIVQPGVYVVEMEGGPRVGYARRQVDLLPKEAREVVLDLQPRYPASMRFPLTSH